MPHKDPEIRKRYQDNYREINRTELRNKNRDSSDRYRQGLRDKVFGHYGRKCECCGTTEGLCIDHVNGDGAEQRELLEMISGWNTMKFYRWLISEGFPEGFQTLCMPCNNSKRHGDHCNLHDGLVL